MTDMSNGNPLWARQRERPLFKFRGALKNDDFDPECQGRAASLLRDSIIYCASPWDLNDPWEARPAFAAPGIEPSSDEARSWISAFCSIQKPDQRDAAERLLKEFGFQEAARRMQDNFNNGSKSAGIFSTGGNATHALLWSYYACGHRGFCWIFDHAVEPFASAMRVTYQETYPEFNWSQWNDEDHLRLAFLTKAKHWGHEDEYRIVLPASLGANPALVPHNGNGKTPLGQYLKVPEAALRGVIFGAGMSGRDRQRLASLARQFGRTLQFFKAGIHRRRYELDMAECTDAELSEPSE